MSEGVRDDRAVTPLLSDRYVRVAADMNHLPCEEWSRPDFAPTVKCAKCAQSWPCATRKVVDALNKSERMIRDSSTYQI